MQGEPCGPGRPWATQGGPQQAGTLCVLCLRLGKLCDPCLRLGKLCKFLQFWLRPSGALDCGVTKAWVPGYSAGILFTHLRLIKRSYSACDPIHTHRMLFSSLGASMPTAR